MTYILDRYCPSSEMSPSTATLSLTADDRTRTRHRFTGDRGEDFYLDLPRGTILRDGDRLTDAHAAIVVTICAKPEPVYTITASSTHHLTQLAYHLGNRHVALEIGQTYLRLQPDPVLKAMLLQLKAQIHVDVLPFSPEVGAYHSPDPGHTQSHAHAHGQSHGQNHAHEHPHGHAHGHAHDVPERSQSRLTTDE